MKGKLAICVIIAALSFSCTQKKIDGIFEFKLGMSEMELYRVVNITLVKDETLSWYRYKESMDDPFKKKYKELHLDYYIVDDDYKIEDIVLYFFEDKLYELSIRKYHPKTEDLLTQKYGLNNKVTKGHKVTTIWETGDITNLRCASVYEIDSIGEERYQLWLSDRKAVDKMYKKKEEHKKKRDKPLLDKL